MEEGLHVAVGHWVAEGDRRRRHDLREEVVGGGVIEGAAHVALVARRGAHRTTAREVWQFQDQSTFVLIHVYIA